MYSCEICGVPVIVLEGQAIRPCSHQEAPVIAKIKAKVIGVGGLTKDK